MQAYTVKLVQYNYDFTTFLGKLLGLPLDGGGGGGGVTNPNFLSHNFLFHSFLRLLRTYMPMTAKREVHRLSEYLIEGALCGVPLNTKYFPVPPPHSLPQL